MRIRKQPRGNARREPSVSRPGFTSQKYELVSCSRGLKERPDQAKLYSSRVEEERGTEQIGGRLEREVSTTRSSFTWLDKLRHAKGFTQSEPYMNFDDFVTSLAKKDCIAACKGKTQIESSSEHVVAQSSLSLSMGTDSHAEMIAMEKSVALQSSNRLSGVETTLRLGILSYDEGSEAAQCSGEKKGGDTKLESDLPKAWSKRDVMAGSVEKCTTSSKMNEYGTSGKPTPYARKGFDDREELAVGVQMKTHKRKGCAESLAKRDKAGPDCERRGTDETTIHILKGQYAHFSLTTSAGSAGREASEPEHLRFEEPQPDNIKCSPTRSTEERSSRNRRVFSSTGGEEGRLPPPAAMPALAPDHPAKQPRQSLLFSLYTIYRQAGKVGLTAREAMSTILQQGLTGLEEGEPHTRGQVVKVLRNSPYFLELSQGRFALCSAIIDAEQNVEFYQPLPNLEEETSNCSRPAKSRKARERKSSTVDSSVDSEEKTPIFQKAQLKIDCGGDESSKRDTERERKPLRSGRPKKLKFLKQENIEELGNQCNRSDGKGWTCPLLAKPGYQLCDHHLDKLRCKPGSRSKKKKQVAATLAHSAQVAQLDLVNAGDTVGHELGTPVDRCARLKDRAPNHLTETK